MKTDFDIARRFIILAHKLEKELDGSPEKLLDLGGYPGTFTLEYGAALPSLKITTADTIENVDEGYTHLTSGTLPFEDDEFDYSISSDVLEHVPPQHRENFLNELIRVTRQKVIICFPFRNVLSEKIEGQLASTWKENRGTEHPWLKEHQEYGLPDAEKVYGLFTQYGGVEAEFAAPMNRWMRHQWWSLMHSGNQDFADVYEAWNKTQIDQLNRNPMEEIYQKTDPEQPMYRIFLTLTKGENQRVDFQELIRKFAHQDSMEDAVQILNESLLFETCSRLIMNQTGNDSLATEINERLESALAISDGNSRHQSISLFPFLNR